MESTYVIRRKIWQVDICTYVRHSQLNKKKNDSNYVSHIITGGDKFHHFATIPTNESISDVAYLK